MSEDTITINECAERILAGWRKKSITVDELGEISIELEPPPGLETKTEPEPVPAAMLERQRPGSLPARPEQESVLTRRLSILIGQAWKHPGKPGSITLNNGLRVDLIVEKKAARYRLLLARQGVYPSDLELKTVLAHWPERSPETVTEPGRKEHNGWMCVVVEW